MIINFLILITQIATQQSFYCYSIINSTKIYPTLNEYFVLQLDQIIKAENPFYSIQNNGLIPFKINQTVQPIGAPYIANDFNIISFAQNTQNTQAAILVQSNHTFQISINETYQPNFTPTFSNYQPILLEDNSTCYQLIYTTQTTILINCNTNNKTIFVIYQNNQFSILSPIANTSQDQLTQIKINDQYLFIGFYQTSLQQFIDSYQTTPDYPSSLMIYPLLNGIPSKSPKFTINSSQINNFSLEQFQVYKNTLWILNYTNIILQYSVQDQLNYQQNYIFLTIGITFNIFFDLYQNQLYLILVLQDQIQVAIQENGEFKQTQNHSFYSPLTPKNQPIEVAMNPWYIFLKTNLTLTVFNNYNTQYQYDYLPYQIYKNGLIQVNPLNTQFYIINKDSIQSYSVQQPTLYTQIDKKEVGMIIISVDSIMNNCTTYIMYESVDNNDLQVYQQLFDNKLPSYISYPEQQQYSLLNMFSGNLIKVFSNMSEGQQVKIIPSNIVSIGKLYRNKNFTISKIIKSNNDSLLSIVQFNNNTLQISEIRQIETQNCILTNNFYLNFSIQYNLTFTVTQLELIQSPNYALIIPNNTDLYLLTNNEIRNIQSFNQKIIEIQLGYQYLFVVLADNSLNIYNITDELLTLFVSLNVTDYLQQLPGYMSNQSIQISTEQNTYSMLFSLTAINDVSMNVYLCLIKDQKLLVLWQQKYDLVNITNLNYLDVLLCNQQKLIVKLQQQLLEYQFSSNLGLQLIKELPLYGSNLTVDRLQTDQVHVYVVIEQNDEEYINIYDLDQPYHSCLYDQIKFQLPFACLQISFEYPQNTLVQTGDAFYLVKPSYEICIISEEINYISQIDYNLSLYSQLDMEQTISQQNTIIVLNSHLSIEVNQKEEVDNPLILDVDDKAGQQLGINLEDYFSGQIIDYIVSNVSNKYQNISIGNYVQESDNNECSNIYFVQQYQLYNNTVYFQTMQSLYNVGQKAQCTLITDFNNTVYGQCPILSIDPFQSYSLTICQLDTQLLIVTDLSKNQTIQQYYMNYIQIIQAQIIYPYIILLGQQLLDLNNNIYINILLDGQIKQLKQLICKLGITSYQIIPQSQQNYSLIWNCKQEFIIYYQTFSLNKSIITNQTQTYSYSLQNYKSNYTYIEAMKLLFIDQDMSQILVMTQKAMDIILQFDNSVFSGQNNPTIIGSIPQYGLMQKTFQVSVTQQAFGILYLDHQNSENPNQAALLIYSIKDIHEKREQQIIEFVTGFDNFNCSKSTKIRFQLTNFEPYQPQQYQSSIQLSNFIIYYSQSDYGNQFMQLNFYNYTTINIINPKENNNITQYTGFTIVAQNYNANNKIQGQVNNSWLNQNQQQNKNYFTNSHITWIVIIVLVLILIVAIVIFILKRKQKRNAEEQDQILLSQEIIAMK